MRVSNLHAHERLKGHQDTRKRQMRRENHAHADPPKRPRPTVEDTIDIDTLASPLSSSDSFWYQRPQDNFQAAGSSSALSSSPPIGPSGPPEHSFDMQAALAGEFNFSAGTEDAFNMASGLTLEDVLSGAGLLESITVQNGSEDGYLSCGEELDEVDCEDTQRRPASEHYYFLFVDDSLTIDIFSGTRTKCRRDCARLLWC